MSQFVADRYAADPIVHYSGSKGFHVSMPTGGFIEPSPENHRIARPLACRLAGEVGVPIDEGVFDRVRLWRAPNSRHNRTGRHKIRVDLDDLLFVNVEQVVRLAAEPIPYQLPAASPPSRLVAEWCQVAGEVHRRHDVRQDDRRKISTAAGDSRVNPLTRSLLTDPTSIQVGERHKAILSAAANLAEFSTVDEIITALLTPPALDTGLPPREVRRQIESGIALARRQTHREGDTA